MGPADVRLFASSAYPPASRIVSPATGWPAARWSTPFPRCPDPAGYLEAGGQWERKGDRAAAVHDIGEGERALGDPVRLEIVRLLTGGKLLSTGEIADTLGLPASRCSYHLRQLLTTGVNECIAEGTTRYPVLRKQALDERFPGLLNAHTAHTAPRAQ
ncbi:ArsR/SmtB family transcription factor [Nocardia sp. NPDC004711]